ncbi:hypothetical protein M501DRAFT_1004223 [Patellaria atrata CBS 101060]|uniref:Uncharacterized protein n=1 Tax=Patellaria atrata CBS 101060 TaxID=1346257 RepID=A0A9P4S9I9_9PEZI|nr:hypothetical protein M501DRAFT_1004223 [Patellaria atrata CBS 101060]
MRGVSATSKVVTSSDTIGRAILIQPGNREWSTVIECVNATGCAIPALRYPSRTAPPVKLVSGSTR